MLSARFCVLQTLGYWSHLWDIRFANLSSLLLWDCCEGGKVLLSISVCLVLCDSVCLCHLWLQTSLLSLPPLHSVHSSPLPPPPPSPLHKKRGKKDFFNPSAMVKSSIFCFCDCSQLVRWSIMGLPSQVCNTLLSSPSQPFAHVSFSLLFLIPASSVWINVTIQVHMAGGSFLIAWRPSHMLSVTYLGQICLDNFISCCTEIVDADQTCFLTQSQTANTRPTNPSTWQR